MIFIENVKYCEYIPPLEDELEQMVSEHSKEIFGNKSLYFNTKKQIKTGAGIISIPDGYVLMVEPKPRWHVVEIELSGHNVYQHVVPQISRFVHGIKNPEVRHKLTEELYNHLIEDQIMLGDFKEMNNGELFKYISDCVKTQPSITVIAEQVTPELLEALETLADNIVEFKTFKSLNGNHAHSFDPLASEIITIKPLVTLNLNQNYLNPENYKAPVATKLAKRAITVSRRNGDQLETVGNFSSAAKACEHLKLPVGGDSACRVLRRNGYIIRSLSNSN